jgi:hypothetical protein
LLGDSLAETHVVKITCLSNPGTADGRAFDNERGEKSNLFVRPIRDFDAKAVENC